MIAFGRREFLTGAGAALVCGPAFGAGAADEIGALEKTIGGRVGLSALDTGSGRRIAHRADERFAMASTFKWLLAAFVLARADQGAIRLADTIAYTKADLLPHSPVTSAHVGEGALAIDVLCAAAVEESDNTAANLLLGKLGGPGALTAFLRTAATPKRASTARRRISTPTSATIRATRRRPPRRSKTSTGSRSAAFSRPASRDKLTGWLKASVTGLDRLRAGLPADWAAGDKTGTGANGAANDVAIAWPPGRAPVLIACYMSGSSAKAEVLNAAHAKIAAIVAAAFA